MNLQPHPCLVISLYFPVVYAVCNKLIEEIASYRNLLVSTPDQGRISYLKVSVAPKYCAIF